MRHTPKDMHALLRRKLVGRLVDEAYPRADGWPGAPETPLHLRAIDRFMAFRSHPLYHEIRAALLRMDEGNYGRCTHCGTAIPAEFLLCDPVARFCERCGPQVWGGERAALPDAGQSRSFRGVSGTA